MHFFAYLPECYSDADCKYGQCFIPGTCDCGLGQIKDGRICNPGKKIFTCPCANVMAVLASGNIGSGPIFQCKLVVDPYCRPIFLNTDPTREFLKGLL